MSNVRTVRVHFESGAPRTGPLTWAQYAGWNRLLAEPTTPEAFAITKVLPVAGCDPERLPEALRAVVERYEALRSSFRLDAQGRPRQDVLGTGWFDVEFRRARLEHGEDPAQSARAAAAALVARAGDVTGSWHTWFAVITDADDAPTHLAIALSHFFTDGAGIEIVCARIEAGLAAQAQVPREVNAWHPIDQALFEHTPTAIRANERALGYWAHHLSVGPSSMLGERVASHPEPRFVGSTMRSPALAAAVRRLAESHGVSPMVVTLTLLCLALDKGLGIRDQLIEMMASNRIRPETAEAVCNIAQNCLFHVVIEERAFATAVKSVAHSALLALRYSRHDPNDLKRVTDRVRGERGSAFERSVFFNFTAVLSQPVEADARPPSAATELREGTASYESGATRLAVTVGGNDAALWLQFWSDIDFVSVECSVAMLRDMETTALALVGSDLAHAFAATTTDAPEREERQ